jgi:hypothetical protein
MDVAVRVLFVAPVFAPMRPDRNHRNCFATRRQLWLVPAAALVIGAGLGANYALAGRGHSTRVREDARATAGYLAARQRYLASVASEASEATRAQNAVAESVGRHCPGILRRAPRGPMTKLFVREILDVVTLAGEKVRLSAQSRFANEVRGLHWSDAQIATMVARLVAARNRLLRIGLPSLCEDASTWAASHFSTLGSETLRLRSALGSTQFTFAAAEGRHTLEAAIFERLERYETATQRNRAKRLARPASSAPAGQRTPAWAAIIDSLGMYQS